MKKYIVLLVFSFLGYLEASSVVVTWMIEARTPNLEDFDDLDARQVSSHPSTEELFLLQYTSQSNSRVSSPLYIRSPFSPLSYVSYVSIKVEETINRHYIENAYIVEFIDIVMGFFDFFEKLQRDIIIESERFFSSILFYAAKNPHLIDCGDYDYSKWR
ncbi:MAG: hypothetical protein KBD31_01025 [Proteobacteria bacterium]|nr:hypothetical protein [Pseudomonadota bacterium]